MTVDFGNGPQTAEIKLLTGASEMDLVSRQWRDLERRCADPMTYFQSFDWCRTWCRFHAEADDEAERTEDRDCATKPRICTVWNGNQLILVWPMIVVGSSRTINKVTALGEPHSQYGNLLIDPVLRENVKLPAILKQCLKVITENDRPDVVVIDSVPVSPDDGSEGLGEVMNEADAGSSAWMDLTSFADWQSYRDALSSSLRRGRNKRRNALERLGVVDYQVRFGGENGFAEFVRDGIEFKRRWLSETGRATRVLNLPNIIEFLSALPGDADNGGAVATALTLDGRPIAVEIGFLWHGRFYSYLGSFDWELRSYSPGKVQLEEALRWCIERRVTAYDLLGDPASYKSDWSNRETPMRLYRTSPTMRGKIFVSMWSNSVRPAMRRLFKSAPMSLRTRLIPFAERLANKAAIKGK